MARGPGGQPYEHKRVPLPKNVKDVPRYLKDFLVDSSFALPTS